MKAIFLLSWLFSISTCSAFSNNGLPSKTAFSPLTMLPKNTSPESFYPFDESSSTLMAAPNKEADDGSGGVRQLLGLKGASEETDIWKIRLQLTKVRL